VATILIFNWGNFSKVAFFAKCEIFFAVQTGDKGKGKVDNLYRGSIIVPIAAEPLLQ